MDTLNSVNECEKAAQVVVFHQQSTNNESTEQRIQLTRSNTAQDSLTSWRHYHHLSSSYLKKSPLPNRLSKFPPSPFYPVKQAIKTYCSISGVVYSAFIFYFQSDHLSITYFNKNNISDFTNLDFPQSRIRGTIFKIFLKSVKG